ncbi:MAG: hypothetical protein ACTSPY_13790 [Candidatus Helarchaeota archaeon]
MSEEPSKEEIQEMLEKAKEIADKKREEQASKVKKLDVGDTSELETVLEKKISEKKE